MSGSCFFVLLYLLLTKAVKLVKRSLTSQPMFKLDLLTHPIEMTMSRVVRDSKPSVFHEKRK